MPHAPSGDTTAEGIRRLLIGLEIDYRLHEDFPFLGALDPIPEAMLGEQKHLQRASLTTVYSRPVLWR